MLLLLCLSTLRKSIYTHTTHGDETHRYICLHACFSVGHKSEDGGGWKNRLRVARVCSLSFLFFFFFSFVFVVLFYIYLLANDDVKKRRREKPDIYLVSTQLLSFRYSLSLCVVVVFWFVRSFVLLHFLAKHEMQEQRFNNESFAFRWQYRRRRRLYVRLSYSRIDVFDELISCISLAFGTKKRKERERKENKPRTKTNKHIHKI